MVSVGRANICTFLGKYPKKYSHHAFRRSLVTELHANNATTQLIKSAGQRSSKNLVSHYIVNSIGEKRKIAEILTPLEEPSSKDINRLERSECTA